MFSWPVWSLETAHSPLGCGSPAHRPKAAGFVWDLEQETALQQVQAAVQAALPLGPYDPADLIVLEVSVAARDAVWSL